MKKILCFLFLPVSLYAQNNHAALIAQYMKGQHDFFNFNGSVLVAEKGKPIYQQALGYADYNTRRMLNDSSVFELASVSKQFTAMGIMTLKEKGKLKYEDEAKKFLPDFPYDHITIRQLLTHTSGLPSYEDQFEKNWDHKKIARNKDIIDMLISQHDTLLFASGSKWQYSNTGFAVLASIIEKVSGQPYNDFLAENIFRPLGMNHTYVYNSRRSEKKIPANYALGFVYSDSLHRYILPDSLPALDMVYFLDGIVGDGTVNSTTGDLLKWVNALKTKKLLPASAIDEMLSPLVQLNPRDSSSYYGFGVFVEPHSPQGKVVHP